MTASGVGREPRPAVAMGDRAYPLSNASTSAAGATLGGKREAAQVLSAAARSPGMAN